MRLNYAWLLFTLAACGPKTPGGETEGGSGDTSGETSTSTTTTGDVEPTTSTTTSASTTPETTTPGSEATGESETTGPVAMCPAPQTPDVMFDVVGFPEDFQGHVQASCTVKGASLGDGSDAVTLSCDVDGTDVEVAVSFDNAAVQLPEGLQQLDAPVSLRYVRADYEYRGEWLAIGDFRDVLLLGLAAGSSALPFVEGEGQIGNMFAPVSVEELGGFCPKGQGSCFALGEPAVLRFSSGDDTLEAFPLQAGQLGPYAVHAGASWLSDSESEYQCDGPSDDWAAFALARQ
ncbi:hypothetical protein SAMN02745121_04523 [Nannocystis exedens]|uniref:Uncharacterized protein n=1 Tax=Nannocystis exedens TaxID=54 RepID=A0A1I2B821_9BACT|nr:hypothetical protein [Nannocystis exedens]PCC68132.1 hypothetical protein NAEX_01141 [Nannocystis exedens]SFE52352.1 hypothetical protein SAMN02745121_04523 [Nannocystis exedens]